MGTTKADVERRFDEFQRRLTEEYDLSRLSVARIEFNRKDKRDKNMLYHTMAVLNALDEIMFKMPQWGISPEYDEVLIRQRREKIDFLFEMISK